MRINDSQAQNIMVWNKENSQPLPPAPSQPDVAKTQSATNQPGQAGTDLRALMRQAERSLAGNQIANQLRNSDFVQPLGEFVNKLPELLMNSGSLQPTQKLQDLGGI